MGACHGCAETQRRVGVVVGREEVGDRLGVVQERLDVDPGEPARDEAEGSQCGVATADVGVGVDDAVAGLPGILVERAARVGDDDDPLGGVEARLGERALVGPALGVGLDGRAGLAGHHDDGPLEPVGQCGADVVGVGEVEDGQLLACRRADDLGREGRPPMPHRTTWSRPRPCKWSRRAAISPTSGREVLGSPTQASRTLDSGSASGPQSVGSFSNRRDAKFEVTSVGTCVAIASAAGPDAVTDRALTGRPSPGRT